MPCHTPKPLVKAPFVISIKWDKTMNVEAGTLKTIKAMNARAKLGLVFINWDCNKPMTWHINES